MFGVNKSKSDKSIYRIYIVYLSYYIILNIYIIAYVTYFLQTLINKEAYTGMRTVYRRRGAVSNKNLFVYHVTVLSSQFACFFTVASKIITLHLAVEIVTVNGAVYSHPIFAVSYMAIQFFLLHVI